MLIRRSTEFLKAERNTLATARNRTTPRPQVQSRSGIRCTPVPSCRRRYFVVTLLAPWRSCCCNHDSAVPGAHDGNTTHLPRADRRLDSLRTLRTVLLHARVTSTIE